MQRQCEWEYIDPLKEEIESVDVVLSLACGIGVQALAQRFPTAHVLPGVNTTFLGLPEEPGVFSERCAACGDCILEKTGGISVFYIYTAVENSYGTALSLKGLDFRSQP